MQDTYSLDNRSTALVLNDRTAARIEALEVRASHFHAREPCLVLVINLLQLQPLIESLQHPVQSGNMSHRCWSDPILVMPSFSHVP